MFNGLDDFRLDKSACGQTQGRPNDKKHEFHRCSTVWTTFVRIKAPAANLKGNKNITNMLANYFGRYSVGIVRLLPVSDTTKSKCSRGHRIFTRRHRSSPEFMRIHRNCIEVNELFGFSMELHEYSLTKAFMQFSIVCIQGTRQAFFQRSLLSHVTRGEPVRERVSARAVRPLHDAFARSLVLNPLSRKRYRPRPRTCLVRVACFN